MTQAIRQLCRIIFDTTDILRIYAEPFAYNTGSRRALEKAGFCCEGTLKSNAVKNGKVLDMVMYSLTRTTEPYPVRRLNAEELQDACRLMWEVFGGLMRRSIRRRGSTLSGRALRIRSGFAG